jgi:hypothetical protein
MKKVLTIVMVFASMFAISQESEKVNIAYVTESKDTIYVMEDFYSLFVSLWEDESNKPYLKPVNEDELQSFYIKEEND